MSLWYESLGTLRRRFEATADQHGALYCVMVERMTPSGHVEYADFPPRKPSPDASNVAGGVHLYGEPKIVGTEVRPPRVREWRIYGTITALRAFEGLARDAGRLLVRDGEPMPDCVAAETLVTDDDAERWLWAMFDLAWNPAEGSPLFAKRMAWAGNVSIPLAQVEDLQKSRGERLDDPIGQALALIPDPPDAYYSIIEDLLATSCYAIDQLQARRTAEETPAQLSEPSAELAPSASVSDDALLSPTKLAEIFGVPAEALRNRLNRWRGKNLDGWIENQERKPREAKYLYQVAAVRPIIDALRATSGATSERPAKKV